MADRLQFFRQPVVTATGIFLGFLLNFSQRWAPNAFEAERLFDVEILITLGVCITVLITVLYRIMSINYPEDEDNFKRYYKITLRLFVLGLVLPFVAILAILVEKIFLSK